MFKKLQLKLLYWVVAKKKARDEKPHKKPNICNDCNAVTIPLYQVSILNLGFYVLIGILIGVFWNVLLGVVIALVSIFTNFYIAKPECRECHSQDIEIYKPVAPTKLQQQVQAFDAALVEKANEDSNEKELDEMEEELVEIEKEVNKTLVASETKVHNHA